MKQNARQEAILDIIEKNEVGTQEELSQLLKEAGFEATQATVSRDINSLNLIKSPGTLKKFRYAQKNNDEQTVRLARILRESVLSVEAVMNIVVIKTYPGHANAACIQIDKQNFSQIAGCLAGDDTIFIICRSSDDADKIIKILKGYL